MASSPSPKPWVQTPCIRSVPLSRIAGCNVYLKLETLQPSGSFKSRGVGNLVSTSIASHDPSQRIRFYCSSGGNAGLACAHAAIALNRPATIVVSILTTEFMMQKLRDLGVEVVQKGNHWQEADTYLREVLLASDPNGVYVPPFDHPDIWTGHATLVEELERQMSGAYDAVVCSVGGGGLFCGIMEGLEKHGHLGGGEAKPVKVLAVETKGADSLNLSLRNGALSSLPAITSIATSLGAPQVAKKAFEWGQTPDVTSQVLSDAEAAMACVHFADDERILVESACGAAIAPVYNGLLRKTLFAESSNEEFKNKNIVIVVCGGSNVALATLEGYRQKYASDETVLRTFGARKL